MTLRNPQQAPQFATSQTRRGNQPGFRTRAIQPALMSDSRLHERTSVTGADSRSIATMRSSFADRDALRSTRSFGRILSFNSLNASSTEPTETTSGNPACSAAAAVMSAFEPTAIRSCTLDAAARRPISSWAEAV